MKKLIEAVNTGILILLLFILLFVCYSKYIQKEPVVKLDGYAILIVLTDSMEPTIQGNELILIKEEDEYQLGDIVTYQDRDHILITHRIVQIDSHYFVAKGDGNDASDEKLELEQIEGKVIFHSKLMGIFVFYYLKFIILVYMIVMLSVYFVKNVIKEKENEEKES